MKLALAVQVTVKSHVVTVVVGSHVNDQVYLVIEDQMYFVASNIHEAMRSLIPLQITG